MVEVAAVTRAGIRVRSTIENGLRELPLAECPNRSYSKEAAWTRYRDLLDIALFRPCTRSTSVEAGWMLGAQLSKGTTWETHATSKHALNPLESWLKIGDNPVGHTEDKTLS